MDVKLMLDIFPPTVVTETGFQRPSAKTNSSTFFMFLRGDLISFKSEQPMSRNAINMMEIIIFNIFLPHDL
jgi:hypothetical protein